MGWFQLCSHLQMLRRPRATGIKVPGGGWSWPWLYSQQHNGPKTSSSSWVTVSAPGHCRALQLPNSQGMWLMRRWGWGKSLGSAWGGQGCPWSWPSIPRDSDMPTGMGLSTVSAARIYKGQLAGGSGEESVLAMETFPHVALAKVSGAVLGGRLLLPLLETPLHYTPPASRPTPSTGRCPTALARAPPTSVGSRPTLRLWD